MRLLHPGSSTVTAPSPLLRTAFRLWPHRIQYNIPTDLKQMALLLYDYRRISSLKNMPDSFMPLVECLRVHAIKLPHSFRQVSIRGFYYEMIVIVHQPVCMAEPVESYINIPEDIEKKLAIFLISKYRFLLITP